MKRLSELHTMTRYYRCGTYSCATFCDVNLTLKSNIYQSNIPGRFKASTKAFPVIDSNWVSVININVANSTSRDTLNRNTDGIAQRYHDNIMSVGSWRFPSYCTFIIYKIKYSTENISRKFKS